MKNFINVIRLSSLVEVSLFHILFSNCKIKGYQENQIHYINSTLLTWIQKLEIESQFMNFTCTLCIVDLTPLGVKTLARVVLACRPPPLRAVVKG